MVKSSRVVYLFLFMLILVMCFSCVYADEPTILGDKYLVKLGASLEFVDGNPIITSSDDRRAKVNGNNVLIRGSGTFTIELEMNGQTKQLDFFAWDTHLKSGKYTVYKDIDKEKKASKTIKGDLYLAVSETSNSKLVQLDEYVLGKGGSCDDDLIGMYITDYWYGRDLSSNKNYEYSRYNKSLKYTFPLADLGFSAQSFYEEPDDDEIVIDDGRNDVEVAKNEKKEINKNVQYTLNVKSVSNGTISPKGKMTIYEGESKEFIVTPKDGYKIKKVTAKNASVDVEDNKITIENVTKNTTLQVTMEKIKTYTVSVDASSSYCTVSPAKKVKVLTGDSVQFEINIKDNKSDYVVKSYSVSKGSKKVNFTSEGNVLNLANITGNVTIKVKFGKASSGSNQPKVNYDEEDHQIEDVRLVAASSSGADRFLELAGELAQWLTENKVQYKSKVDGMTLDCVTYVKRVLEQYGVSGVSTKISSWYDEAYNMRAGRKTSSWMADNFDIVYLSSNKNAGMTASNFKDVTLQPGDILVCTAGGRNHIEILGDIDYSKSKSSKIRIARYSIGESNYFSNSKIGPYYLKCQPYPYDYTFESGKGFATVSAVLRLK